MDSDSLILFVIRNQVEVVESVEGCICDAVTTKAARPF